MDMDLLRIHLPDRLDSVIVMGRALAATEVGYLVLGNYKVCGLSRCGS
jgi:hypothetical protein